MRKLFTTLFLAAYLSLGAQTTLSTAVDFSVTTTSGDSFNLFSKLAEGKYVLVDFFFTTCPACISTSPYYKQSFIDYGCNTGGVYFISIDQGDTDAEVLAYEGTYYTGADIPSASGNNGGGNSVCTTYGISAYPTYILIAPNHDIVEQDMWPIGSAADFTNYLTTQNGIAQQSCATSGIDDLANVHVALYPNPAVNTVSIASLQQIQLTQISIVNMYGQTVLSQNISSTDVLTFDVSGLANGMYVMNMITDKGIKQETFVKN
jgi:cytochrome oxidase Cu insertion factor (SCO1/SenC/PrrC family)